jgi:peptide/nickel transport system substrate-binding protein
VQKNRAAARDIMTKLGYGPDKKLALTVSTRNVPTFRDPAIIMIDQLKEIYIDAVLETVETANWHAKVTRKDYKVAINATGSGVDDPDQLFFENYACNSLRNYSGYCNRELDKKFDEQSAMTDQEARKKLVWEIDRQLQEDGARPIISHNVGATCMQARVKGLTIMVNSIFNGWRFEDVWLEQ